jgi:polyisoprenoid-binding protein YceI
VLVLVACARAAETPLAIDKEHSRIEVDVKAPFQPFVAQLTAYTPHITVDPSAARIVHAQLHFRFSELKTGKEQRDREMLEWQNTDQFPEAVFTLTRIEPGADGKWRALGRLIFHGVTHEILVSLTVETRDKLVYSIDGDSRIDTRDFGLPLIRKYGLFKVDPEVSVRFHLLGTLDARLMSAQP